jgi:hypothetical protein
LVFGRKLSKENNVDNEKNIIPLFIIIYTSFIIYVMLTACCADRFFAPLYPIMILFIIISMHKILNQYSHKCQKRLVVIIFITCSLLLANAAVAVKRALVFKENGAGMTGEVWKNNIVLNYSNNLKNKDEFCIYSNGPYYVYFYTDVKCVRPAAEKMPYYHAIQIDTRDKVISEIKESQKKVIFVWLNNLENERFYNVDTFYDDFVVIELFESIDGNVYEIVKK